MIDTTLTPARVAEMASKATPGPWTWSYNSLKDMLHVTADNKTSVATITEGWPTSPVDAQAVATLIAAAPDMAALIAKQEAEIERLKQALSAHQEHMEAAQVLVRSYLFPKSAPGRIEQYEFISRMIEHFDNPACLAIQSAAYEALEAKP